MVQSLRMVIRQVSLLSLSVGWVKSFTAYTLAFSIAICDMRLQQLMHLYTLSE